MKKKLILLAILFFAFLSFTGYFILNRIKVPKTYRAQSAQAGVVEVEATPKKLMRGEEMIFTLKLNNHSIDLDYDFIKIAAAVDSNGNIYKPISWSGGTGGHHVSGDLVFDKLSNSAESVGLKIMGIDKQKAIFEWKL